MHYEDLKIVAAPAESPPFPVDAVTVEEDTYLVLSAETTLEEPKEDLMRLMTRMIETDPFPAGSIVVRDARPLLFLAIVHDLNEEPTWKRQWIEKAFFSVLKEAEKRVLRSLGLPLLGTQHGRMRTDQCMKLLARAIQKTARGCLKKLWLIVPAGTARSAIENLKDIL